MGVISAISNSIKNFSKDCFDGMKNRSPKYTNALSKLHIPPMEMDVAASMRKYIGEEMKEILQDRNGYFLKMQTVGKEGVENTFSQVVHGESRQQYQERKEKEAEEKRNPKTLRNSGDYDIGE